ncbi:MAG: hypothetical protein CM15mP111_0600 [Hyphomicrobiales bacterium]|nr:MAG: hypothetical protein CM15mP111_0600 [Hyphomicrobiales bacterium]
MRSFLILKRKHSEVIFIPIQRVIETPPEGLNPQFPLIHKAVEAFNIKCYHKLDMRQMTLFATYSKIASEGMQNYHKFLDKDLMQLINKNVRMYDPMPGKNDLLIPMACEISLE